LPVDFDCGDLFPLAVRAHLDGADRHIGRGSGCCCSDHRLAIFRIDLWLVGDIFLLDRIESGAH